MHVEETQAPLEAVRFWSPGAEDPDAASALGACLSSAFSSGIWKTVPMPLGHGDDPASALGIIRTLGPCPVVVAATPVPGRRIIGCVIGCVMDDRVIQAYGLAEYAAEPGDGLFAFIGIVPEAQGHRFRPGDSGTLASAPEGAGDGCSLARHLFEAWVKAIAAHDCPRLFIRTRPQIGPIRYLSEAMGFELCGRFQVRFRGQSQTRLVYRRTNRRRTAS